MSPVEKDDQFIQMLIDIATLRERSNALREVMELSHTNAQQALELQAKEYDRRLKELNNETARVNMCVTRERFEIEIDSLKRDIATLLSFKDRSLGKTSVVSVATAISLLVNVAFLIFGK